MKPTGPAPISIWRTTILRLLLVYAAVFTVSVFGLFGLNYWQSANYTANQADFTIDWQFRYFEALPADLMLEKMGDRMRADVRRPTNYYGVFDRSGKWVFGDVLALPPALEINGPGQWLHPMLAPTTVRPSRRTRMMATRLPDGSTLLVARDVDEMTRLRNFMLGGLVWGGAMMMFGGVAFGLIYGSQQLRRIRAIHRVARRIAQGHLDDRLPGGQRDELDLLTQIINHMLDEIVRLMAEVKGACDGIAHDLRTPLIHVRTLLARASGRIENDESRELVDQALSASDDVLARFGAMLRISEIESMNRRGGFADVDLAVLVERVYELYAPMAELKGVALTRRVLRTTRPNPVSGQLDSNVASETHVEADYPLMFEALSNLIDNAIKFTDAGGSVALEIEIRLSGTRIVVRDDGPGIAPDERHAVVQRFYRSEKTRDTPGSGLGLSIVFAVARLHDFRFTIVDAPRGATIHLDCWPQSIA